MNSSHFRAQVTQEFEQTVAQALQVPHMAKYLTYTRRYAEMYVKSRSELGFFYRGRPIRASVQEIQLHSEFIKNLTALRQAIDDPMNHPREIKALRNSKDKKVCDSAANYIPTLKTILDAAVAWIKIDAFYNSESY